MQVSSTRFAPFARVLALLAILAGTLLTGCAQQGNLRVDAAKLLRDDLYPAAQDPSDRQSVFAMSEEMMRYVDTDLNSLSARRDPRRALLDALYTSGELRLLYDASTTRTAAEAFHARAGNCLSLVLMTAAFAQHLGLPLSFQSVQVEDSYTRSGDLMLISGHVNLVLGRTSRNLPFTWSASEDWVVDFLPGVDLRGQRSVPLNEDTVVAMYYNNRAAESLAEGQRDAAYGWARAALQTEPGFVPAINTLGVLYLRDGHMQAAEAALRHVLHKDPDSVSGLSNMALLLQRTQRQAQAEPLLARVSQLRPDEPFVLFDHGRKAMESGNFARARDLFERELKRQPGQSEVLFWLALADLNLGDTQGAARHLEQAVERSANGSARDIYSGKLARLRALQTH